MASSFFGALTQGAKFSGTKFQKDKQQFKQITKGTLSLLMQISLSKLLYSHCATAANNLSLSKPKYVDFLLISCL